MTKATRVLGIDPGLRRTGWGVVEICGTRLSHVANGTVASNAADPLAMRLSQLHDGLAEVVAEWTPDASAVEETFVNRNPASALKLGQARGICLLVPARAGLAVAEYAPNHIKKAVVGSGHADKAQIRAMLGILLPGVAVAGEDAADALAVAICHAHQMGTRDRLESYKETRKVAR